MVPAAAENTTPAFPWFATCSAPVWVATRAALVCIFLFGLVWRRPPPSVEPSMVVELRRSAELLVVAAAVEIVSLMIPSGSPASVSVDMAEPTAFQGLCVLAAFGTLFLGELLLLLSFTRRIPASLISDSAVRALKLTAVAVIAINLLFN